MANPLVITTVRRNHDDLSANVAPALPHRRHLVTPAARRSDAAQIPGGRAARSALRRHGARVVVARIVGDVSGEQVVIVKHGKYYTSYTHLSSFNVSKDQEVKAGTVLGKSGTDIDGQGSLYFMISNDKGTPLNPKSWLRSR